MCNRGLWPRALVEEDYIVSVPLSTQELNHVGAVRPSRHFDVRGAFEHATDQERVGLRNERWRLLSGRGRCCDSGRQVVQ